MSDITMEARIIALAAAGQVNNNADAVCVEALVEKLVATALASARSQARREALEEAAKVAARMLVFADTTSSADKEIPAAIRRLAEQEGRE